MRAIPTPTARQFTERSPTRPTVPKERKPNHKRSISRRRYLPLRRRMHERKKEEADGGSGGVEGIMKPTYLLRVFASISHCSSSSYISHICSKRNEDDEHEHSGEEMDNTGKRTQSARKEEENEVDDDASHSAVMRKIKQRREQNEKESREQREREKEEAKNRRSRGARSGGDFSDDDSDGGEGTSLLGRSKDDGNTTYLCCC